jgi:hypothetical protein
MTGTLSIRDQKNTNYLGEDKRKDKEIKRKMKILSVRRSRNAMYRGCHCVLPSTDHGTSDSALDTGQTGHAIKRV